MDGSSDPAALLARHLPLVDEVARYVARRKHSRADEVEEFVAQARLKMVEDDYAVLRGFQGRARLRTYLTIVLQHLFSDERVRRWGRFRFSAAALRLGTEAKRLEILMRRDGRTADEAWDVLTRNEGWAITRAEFDALVAALPPHVPHRVVGEEELESVCAPGPTSEARVNAREQHQQRCRSHEALTRALAALDVEDRLILKLHFQDGLKIGAVARALGQPEKPFYRRLERLLQHLRSELERNGLGSGDVELVLSEDAPYPGNDVTEETHALDWAV